MLGFNLPELAAVQDADQAKKIALERAISRMQMS
jgi:hypothetical protein